MHLRNATQKIINSQDLSESEMMSAMNDIMSGQASPVQIAGFLIGLETKGLSVAELTAAVSIMHSMACKISIPNVHLVDIVGTGGDNAQTFNISTTSAFVVAAAGGMVAKHGNRSVSSSSGSADVLEYAGVNLNLTEEQTKECIEKLGVGFLFAPRYHPALKHAALPRKELGIRTFFNLLGPLTNPAGASFLVIGVYSKKWLITVAHVLSQLHCQHALIVHSEDGLDEISICAPTHIVELKDKKITQYMITPEQFGFQTQSISSLQVKSPSESYAMMHSVLSNSESAARDIVLLNSGAAIYVAGLADTLEAGIKKAKAVLASGSALEKLKHLVSFTGQFSKTST